MGSARASSNLVVVASFLQLKLGTGCTCGRAGKQEKRKKSKSGLDLVRVAQWIARLPPKEKVVGSNPTSDGSFLFFFFFFFFLERGTQLEKTKRSGEPGYRSLCLMHAKHALYHLS